METTTAEESVNIEVNLEQTVDVNKEAAVSSDNVAIKETAELDVSVLSEDASTRSQETIHNSAEDTVISETQGSSENIQHGDANSCSLNKQDNTEISLESNEQDNAETSLENIEQDTTEVLSENVSQDNAVTNTNVQQDDPNLCSQEGQNNEKTILEIFDDSPVTEDKHVSEDNEHSQNISQESIFSNESEDHPEFNIKNPSEKSKLGKQEVQSVDYNNEYMLENQEENVYMPDQEQEVNLTTQVYSADIISDDSQENSHAIEQKVTQNQNSVATTTQSELPEKMSASDNELERDQENIIPPSAEQSTRETSDKSHMCGEDTQQVIKTEYISSKLEMVSETVNRDWHSDGTDNHDTSDTVGKEVLNREPIIIEDSFDEEENNEPITENQQQNVKAEAGVVKVEDSSCGKNKEPETESENEIYEVEDGNSSTSEIIITPNESSISENSTVQSYAVPKDLEVTEIVHEEGDYTIIETSDSIEISTSQQSEEYNLDNTPVALHSYENPSEDSTPMQLTEEQAYLTELRSQSESRQSVNSQSSETSKPRRGRKSSYDIPMHVLGHDISKPFDSVPNGRALPKPRLGVKVPYRNLTSQIVSKAEIEKEIMERARLKQEQASSKGDILFARKLTQRLAKRIAPSPEPERRTNKPREIVERRPIQTVQSGASDDSSKIHNDSDLLAILEGEGEEMPVLPKEIPEPQTDESSIKMLEREIALQQLQELPHQVPKQRIFMRRQYKGEKAPLLPAETPTTAKDKSSEKITDVQKGHERSEQVPTLSNKENSSSSTSNESAKDGDFLSSPSPKKQLVDVEPQVKVNMVLKTYSRKRKPVEVPEASSESPTFKKTMLNESEIKVEKPESVIPTDVYVTKSSRVIKRKVIWDPDEIPSRSPKTVAKPLGAHSPVRTGTEKSLKSLEKNSSNEKLPDQKVLAEKAKDKVSEKKNIDKASTKKSSISSVNKKKIESPKASKTAIKNKKSRSEVDRLLMDEGAVKMLYELKNIDETVVKKKKDVYSVERAQREILKKANEIKSDLEQTTSNESPKSLRKKEGLPLSPAKPVLIAASAERKLSKDSTRSSVHTPPRSPNFSFAHSQSSMLVRRRSSSSISSSDDVDVDSATKAMRKKSDPSKPKKVKKDVEDSEESTQTEKPSSESPQKPTKLTAPDNKINLYKTFKLKKTNKHVNIDLNYISENCYFTVQMLEELTAALKKFAKDKECNVVSITSSCNAYCLGVDYTSLVSDQEEERRRNATELAQSVRDFLKCLLHFPKVVVAGIQGDCAGLGVTMLPLFDLVIASDTATFSTPYSTLGCVGEAGFLLTLPSLTNHGLAAELLYTGQKLTADDAFRRGLISKLCWPEKYNEILKNILTSISKSSKQSLEATKKQLRSHIVQNSEAAINSETNLLIEHWVSSECQKSFARIASGN